MLQVVRPSKQLESTLRQEGQLESELVQPSAGVSATEEGLGNAAGISSMDECLRTAADENGEQMDGEQLEEYKTVTSDLDSKVGQQLPKAGEQLGGKTGDQLGDKIGDRMEEMTGILEGSGQLDEAASDQGKVGVESGETITTEAGERKEEQKMAGELEEDKVVAGTDEMDNIKAAQEQEEGEIVEQGEDTKVVITQSEDDRPVSQLLEEESTIVRINTVVDEVYNEHQLSKEKVNYVHWVVFGCPWVMSLYGGIWVSLGHVLVWWYLDVPESCPRVCARMKHLSLCNSPRLKRKGKSLEV